MPQDFAPAPETARPHAAARSWTRAELERDPSALVHDFGAAANAEVAAGMDRVRRNGLTLDTVEQEDVRVRSFARAVPDLRRCLDAGAGFVVVRGIDLDPYDDDEAGIVAWILGNYLGRPIRQGLAKDRRLFTVTDAGAANTDPTRIGATAGLSRMHSDNGCLEPRPPCYIALLCVSDAAAGGESTIVSAETVHAAIARERPDLMPHYWRPWHFRPPQLHTWPAGPPTVVKPIFDLSRDGDLQIHYARVMIEPGMEIAGTPVTPEQREALDYLDSVLERPELVWTHKLVRGQMLVTNNLATLHGRLAYRDDGTAGRRRVLKRIWMWRRHIGPGVDPAALDLAEPALA